MNTQPRLDGYIQAIKDHGDGVTYDVVNTGPDPATEISRVESYYLSHKDVAGAVRDGRIRHLRLRLRVPEIRARKKGSGSVAGFDLFPQTLDLIKSGDATFTTDQQAYLQGFLPLQQMYLYKLSGGPRRTGQQ